MKKIFFGTDLRSDKGRYDSDRLVTSRVDTDQKVQVGKASALRDGLFESIPVWAVVYGVLVHTILGAMISVLLFMLVTIFLLQKEQLKPVIDLLEQNPWIAPAAITVYLLLLAFISLMIIAPDSLRPAKFRAKREKSIQEIAEIREASRQALEIPNDAEQIDIFSCAYEITDEGMVLDKMSRYMSDEYIERLDRFSSRTGIGISRKARHRRRFRERLRGDEQPVVIPFRKVTFTNVDCWIYRQDGKVYIVDGVSKMVIPCEGFTGIRKIKGRTLFTGWNKQEKHNRGEYRAYGIKKLGIVPDFRVWNYYALTFTAKSEEYDLYFPAYELATVEKLTDVRYDG